MLSVALIDMTTLAFLWGFYRFTFLPCVLVAQLCLSLSDPINCSLPGSCVHGILQARILEWVVIPFSRVISQPRIESRSHVLQAYTLPSETQGKLTLKLSHEDTEVPGCGCAQLCPTLRPRGL